MGTYPKQNQGIEKKNEMMVGGDFDNKDSILLKKLDKTYKKFYIIYKHDTRQ